MVDQPTSDRGFVVIVDDDGASAKTLAELLENEGYSVECTKSGGHVLETIASTDANLGLLDTHLAHADAFDLLAKLKQTQHGRDLPVIFLTARRRELQEQYKGISECGPGGWPGARGRQVRRQLLPLRPQLYGNQPELQSGHGREPQRALDLLGQILAVGIV